MRSSASKGVSASVEQTEFRAAMSRYPTGVAIVTAVVDDAPIGFTVGTFNSISLDPPLVTFSVTKTSTSWPSVQQAGAFCVNVLGASGEDLCWRFSRPSDDRFADVTWWSSPLGSAVLACATVWFDCTLDAVHGAGDHWIVLGEVGALQVSSDEPPLIFQGGNLATTSGHGATS